MHGCIYQPYPDTWPHVSVQRKMMMTVSGFTIQCAFVRRWFVPILMEHCIAMWHMKYQYVQSSLKYTAIMLYVHVHVPHTQGCMSHTPTLAPPTRIHTHLPIHPPPPHTHRFVPTFHTHPTPTHIYTHTHIPTHPHNRNLPTHTRTSFCRVLWKGSRQLMPSHSRLYCLVSMEVKVLKLCSSLRRCRANTSPWPPTLPPPIDSSSRREFRSGITANSYRE